MAAPLIALALLAVAAWRIPSAPAQSAVPLSRPGQEDLTFWANHNGLEQIEVEGEVGFGDMARILLRRRSNVEAIRKLRDRFTFRVQDMAALNTADAFRAELSETGLEWRSRPERFAIAAGRTFNLPLIVENRTRASVKVQAGLAASSMESAFANTELSAGGAGGYFLRVVESRPGKTTGHLVVRAGDRQIGADVSFDVRPLVTLRVRLLDEDGRPTAARVYLTAADGLAYAPRGSVSRITAMGADYYFHAENTFEIDLPSGSTVIEATRGQEYELAHRATALEPGRSETIELRLKRWDNMAAKGWYSADAHIHANYTRPHHQVITPADVRLQAHAEDLNNANLMVANSSGAFVHDAQYFEGRPSALSEPNFILYWNEEMRSSGMYGHMSLFNLKRLVEPLYTGFRGTPYADDYPANYTQAEAAQKQGGAVTYVHPANGVTFETVGGVGGRELPVDLALGQVDALDVVSNVDEIAATELWYRLLNCGFRLAISAGTDSFTNVADHYTAGGGRVYVHAGQHLQYEEWIRNYKRGRSFASNGPALLLTVDDKEPGEELRLAPRRNLRVHVKAAMRTQVPVEKVEIVVNGKVALSRAAADRQEVTIDEAIPVTGSAWIAARALGRWHRLVLNDVQAFAHTSPVYVYVGDRPIASAADARFWIDWIERLIAQVNTRARFTTPEQRKEVVDLFRRAQEVYRGVEQKTARRSAR